MRRNRAVGCAKLSQKSTEQSKCHRLQAHGCWSITTALFNCPKQGKDQISTIPKIGNAVPGLKLGIDHGMAPTAFVSPNSKPAERPALLNLLIVDDERAVRDAAKDAALILGYRAATVNSPEPALHLLESQNFDVVLFHLKLPGAVGVEFLRDIKSRRPDIEGIVVTGHGTVESAVQAMKAGAYDYVTEPFSLEELKMLLQRLAAHLKLKTDNRILNEKLKSKHGFASIIGSMPEMEKLYRIIVKAAYSAHPVLILGESGTGKEMVARAIHYSRPYRDKAFIPVDLRLVGTNADLNVLTLRIPPLRDRRQDVPLLAGHILERVSKNSGKTYERSDDA
jgi:DNA-binding NtrC family response regulator